MNISLPHTVMVGTALWLPMVTYGYIISVCGCKRIRYLCFRIMGPLTVSDVVIWQAPDVLFKIIPV